MSSKRFPNKMMKKILGKTLLERVVNQVLKSKYVNKVIVVTSNLRSDRPIVNFCKRNKISYFSGSLNNVAKRYYEPLKNINSKYFIRINGDSPLIDPNLIDKFILQAKKTNLDIVTNCMHKTFPKGQSVEIIKTNTFKKSYKNIKKKYDREHVTNFFYKNKNKFKIKNIYLKKNYNFINLCIDRSRDISIIKKILKRFNNQVPKIDIIINNYKKILASK
jgi:spore coat polysaccharide biosynthesis protein SpsF (cytidylyltransferase family)